MNDQPQGTPPKKEDAGRVVVVVIGAALVLLGLSLLARQYFWPGLALTRMFGMLRAAGWGFGLIIIGVITIIWTQRPDFRPPAKGAQLYRSRTDRVLGGVLGGVAEYLGMDATLVRLAFAGLSLMFGVWPAIVAYVVAMFIVPEVPLGGPAERVPDAWPAPPAPAPGAPPPPPPPPPPPAPPAAPAPVPWPEGAAAPYAPPPAQPAPEVAAAPPTTAPAPPAAAVAPAPPAVAAVPAPPAAPLTPSAEPGTADPE